jgi:hypothetical protein
VIQKYIEQEVRLQKFRARRSSKKWGLCCASTGRLQLENCVSGHKTHNLVFLLLLLNITIIFIVFWNRIDKKYYLRRTPLTNSCVCGCVRIRFGEYGRNLDYADNFSKNVNLPHFLVSVTKTFRPVTHYSKIYSKMHCHWNFYRTKYDIIYYDQNCIFVTSAHAGPFNDKIRALEKTAIALPARYMALAAVTIPVPW